MHPQRSELETLALPVSLSEVVESKVFCAERKNEFHWDFGLLGYYCCGCCLLFDVIHTRCVDCTDREPGAERVIQCDYCEYLLRLITDFVILNGKVWRQREEEE